MPFRFVNRGRRSRLNNGFPLSEERFFLRHKHCLRLRFPLKHNRRGNRGLCHRHGAQHGQGQAVFRLLLHGSADVEAHSPSQNFRHTVHQVFQTLQRQGTSAAHQNQDIVHFSQTFFQKKRGMPDLVQYIRHGSIRRRFTHAKGANPFSRSGYAEQVVQSHPEQVSGRIQQRRHNKHGAGNKGINHGKGFQHPLVGIYEAFHGVIIKPQHHVGIQGKPGQSFIRLGRAPFPLKPEGADDNADDISPLFLGQTGRFRSYAGSRSPSQPGGKDSQRAAFQRTENGRLAFTGRPGSYGGVPAGTDAPGKPGAQMNLARNG